MKLKESESSINIKSTIALYALSGIMFFGFVYMDNSDELSQFLIKADNYKTDTGFFFYALIGIIQYGLLIFGISIFGTLTFMIIKKIKALPVLIAFSSLLLFGCYSHKHDLKYPDLKIKGKKSNKYIVNRIAEYGNGYQDGCIIGGQMSLNIDVMSKDSIAGFIFDSKSKEPLYFSTVRLINIDLESTDTLEIIADEKGTFTSAIKTFPNKVEVKYIGYRTLNIDLTDYEK
jgi:hypothetical protein